MSCTQKGLNSSVRLSFVPRLKKIVGFSLYENFTHVNRTIVPSVDFYLIEEDLNRTIIPDPICDGVLIRIDDRILKYI